VIEFRHGDHRFVISQIPPSLEDEMAGIEGASQDAIERRFAQPAAARLYGAPGRAIADFSNGCGPESCEVSSKH